MSTRQRNILIVLLMFGLIIPTTTLSQKVDQITVPELEEHISFLASDSLKGRKPGTAEGKIAAEYIRDQLKKSGLKLLGENGFQHFEVTASLEPGKNNHLTMGNFKGDFEKDFVPLAYTANEKLNASAAFVGYGFNFKDDSLSWNDYENLDVAGKWVIILRGNPDSERYNDLFEKYSSLRKKILTAKDLGAAGVLFVSGKRFDAEDELIDPFYEKSETDVGVPAFHIKRSLVDSVLKQNNLSIEDLENELNEKLHPHSFLLPAAVSGQAEILKNKVKTQNVVALLEGNDPILKDEYIVLGAHYDHLGFGGPGSGSRRPDTLAVHNGADDNASGVAGVLEVVEQLASQKKKLKRSLLVIMFGAEEMGTLGSKYFTNYPLIDLSKIKFMFNLDMIGRLDQDYKALTVSGTGTAAGLEEMVESQAKAHQVKVKLSPEGFGPSDHASFYAKDIPVLMFFTGVHDDYHTPNDDTEFINFEGEKTVADFVSDLIFEVSNLKESLAFQEAGPKTQPTGQRRFKVTLGVMPDHSATDIKGMRVDLVIKDRPADRAGMKKGDIIISMESKPVNDIYEYMNRLSDFKSGQRISVEVIRDGKKEILIVEL